MRKTSTQKPKIRYMLLVIVVLWGGTRLPAISWGMPNFLSFAKDSVALRPDRNARDLMEADAYKYPPLLYLIWNTVAPAHPVKVTKNDELTRINTHRYRKFRTVNSVMSLGTTFLIFFICYQLLKLDALTSFFAALVFLLNPMTTYYSLTTNMEQAYVFWFVFSLYTFLLTIFSLKPGKKPSAIYWVGNAFAGIFMAFSVCTKDQIYGVYIIPIVTWLLWLAFRRKQRLYAVSTLILLAVSFSISFLIIYKLIGGSEVFEFHLRWITGEGSKSYARYTGSLIDRGRLLFKATGDLIVALDWPLIAGVLVMLAGIITKRIKSKMLIFIAFLAGLSFLSYQAFFIQVIKYSFPRFHLPFVPLTVILLACAVSQMRRSYPLFAKVFSVVLVSILMLTSIQMTASLVRDPRVALRQEMTAIISSRDTEPAIAVDASEFGKRYEMIDGKFFEVRAIRNWGANYYGMLSDRQRSIMIDPLYLALTQPAIVVLNRQGDVKFGILREQGFELVKTIVPMKNLCGSLFQHESPTMYIFERGNIPYSIGPEDVTNSFEDQLLIFQQCLHPDTVDAQIKIFGSLCADFKEPDLQVGAFNTEYYRLLVNAYNVNKRYPSALEAARFYKRLVGGNS